MGQWSWRLSSIARTDFADLAADEQQRIAAKLDEICTSPWRDPPDYGEPLRNSPYKKVRVGPFRLSASFDRDDLVLTVHRIKSRSDAYTADD